MIPLCPVVYHPDLRMWETVGKYTYKDIDVEAGFLMDLASIPRLLWGVIGPFELSVEAPVVHDLLYSTGGLNGKYTRAECDMIFYEIMALQEIDIFKRVAAYQAVREFGGPHWCGAPDPSEKSNPGDPLTGLPFRG